jgi:carbonic anhydrase
VVAVMYEQGKKNQALDGLWQQYRYPQKVLTLNADQFLPTHRDDHNHTQIIKIAEPISQ